MKFSRSLASAIGATFILVGGASVANASYSWQNYDVTVPRFGGTAFTGSQVKTDADDPADLRSGTVTRGYTLQARFQGTSVDAGVCSVWKSVKCGTTLTMGNCLNKGWSAHIKFKSGLTTPYTHGATGSWRAR